MQPYFDPTNKTTSNENWRRPQRKRKKLKTTSKNGKKMEDNLIFLLKKQEWRPQKNERWPQNKNGRRPKKNEMEDDL